MSFLPKKRSYNYAFISVILFITNLIIIPASINNPLSIKGLLIFYIIAGFLSLLFIIFIFIKNNINNEEIKVNSILYKIYDYLGPLMIAISLFILIFGNLIVLGEVSQSSMEPTLKNEQTVLIYKYNFTPKRDDVIIILDEKRFDEPIIKRVIAVPGDTIKFVEDVSSFNEEGHIYINNVLYKNQFGEDSIFSKSQYRNMVKQEFENGIFKSEVTLSDGYYIVLGDNFFNSSDSRNYGAFHKSKIIGKMISIRRWKDE